MLDRSGQPPRDRAVPRAPWIILAISLAVTGAVAVATWFTVHSRDLLRFQNAAEGAHDRIVERLATYIAVLRSTEGLFAASAKVSREEFQRYVQRLDLQRTYPGIQGVGYAERVRQHEVSAVEAREQAAGVEDFRVWPRGSADDYFPIVYLEPLERRNRAALGYDMFSEPVRRAAMERARDTGAPAMTGRVTLVQEIDPEKQAGFLIYVPLYAGPDIPRTVEERREKLRGFVYAPFRADDLFARLFGTEQQPRVGITAYDLAVKPENLLHMDRASRQHAASRPTFRREMPVEIAGRPWVVVVRTLPVFDANVSRRLPLGIVLGGTGVSLVLFAVAWSQARAQQRAERERRIALTLTQVGLAVGSELDPERLIQQVTDEAVSLTGAAFGAFFQAGRPGRSSPGPHTVSGAPRGGFDGFGPLRQTALFAHSFQGEGTLRLDDLTRSPLYGDGPGGLAGPPSVRSYLAVTVRSRTGEILGALLLGHPEPGRFQPEHEQLVEGLAAQMAVALDNARLYLEMREAVRHRDEFLSVASHELKTPLTPLSLRLEILRDHASRAPESPLRTLVLGSVETARRQVSRLSRLVTDLLDVSRITAGKLNLQRTDVDLPAIVRDVVHRFEPQLSRAGTAVEVGGEPSLIGEWDAARIEQVVVNLVENAIKYGAGKPIRVEVMRQGDQALLTIEDQGIGIDPQRLPHVFDRFERAVSDRHYGGLGLGLYIARQIVDAHGGTISVISSPGERTVFTVVLPLHPPSSPASRDQPTSSADLPAGP